MQALAEAVVNALSYVLSSVWATSASVFVATIIFLWVRNWLTYQPPVVLTYQPVMCGDITLESLTKYDGRDFLKPLYFAVRGKVYDVTKGKDFYGPGEYVWLQDLLCELASSCSASQGLGTTSLLGRRSAEP